jgi:hypothetical protein
MLCASGQQFADWSAAYRLFENERFDQALLFAPARRGVLERLPQEAPVVAHLDDTRGRKRGRKVAGAGWHRDPLGPHFHTNLIWAQRFLQISLALPESSGPCRARAIPVDFQHCPLPPKPHKTAPDSVWEQWREERKRARISNVASQRLTALRDNLDGDPTGGQRPLVVSIDGGYTNASVFKNIPERTRLIGRIRKDARLYSQPPAPTGARGDAAGPRDLRLVVIRPLAYRLTQGSRALYRQPAYLICTDPDMSLEQLLQAYLWRWEIEVNFRDQKTLLGMGQAQVRQAKAVARVPAFITAAYAYLLLGQRDVHRHERHGNLRTRRTRCLV